MGKKVARMEEGRSALRISTGEPIGRRPLRGPSCRWEDNIRIDHKEIGVNMRNLIDSAQDRVYRRAFVNAALNLWVL